jgi:hypothetical protein
LNLTLVPPFKDAGSPSRSGLSSGLAGSDHRAPDPRAAE